MNPESESGQTDCRLVVARLNLSEVVILLCLRPFVMVMSKWLTNSWSKTHANVAGYVLS